MDDLVAEIELLKQRMTEMEEWCADLAGVLRQRTEELRQAAGRLEQADVRYRALLQRTDEIERFAADQLGADVADLRKAMRGIGVVASGLMQRPVEVQ